MWSEPVNGDIIGYNVYRKTTLKNDYKQINKDIIPALSYIEQEQLEYEQNIYAVTAVDRFGNESKLSQGILLKIGK